MGGPPMPPGASPRGRGNFQAFMAGSRQGYDGGRGGGVFRSDPLTRLQDVVCSAFS